MASHTVFDTHIAEQKVKTLVNAQLKSILKRERLLLSGVKAAMQKRIVDQLRLYAANQDLDRFNRLKGFIDNPGSIHSPAPPQLSHQIPYSNFSPTVGRQPDPPTLMQPGPSGTARLIFKESPFYTILQHLTPVQECKAVVREATRDTIECKIILKPDVADKLVSEPNLKVMVFCASEPISHFAKVDIAFPHQVEIKVNLDEVKANLRGLKNRAGSTRPADITNLLRKRANYENSMTLTYALTHKKFYFIVNLVRQHSVEELVARLKSGKIISKDQVIREMPVVNIAYRRALPLNGMHPQPMLRRIVVSATPGASTDMDLYVDDILKSTPRSVDQVTVEPDGKWSRISEDDLPARPGRDSSSDDEDLVEIKDPPRVTAVKNEMTNSSISMRTPPTSSREQSTTSSVPPSSIGAKRSVSAVIDLTSDDDEESLRQSKKPATPAYLATPTYQSSANFRAHPLGNGVDSRDILTHRKPFTSLIIDLALAGHSNRVALKMSDAQAAKGQRL
ncbi:MAG: hypothetical protein Q9213_000051 [Squamulea squamosa]